MLPKWFDKWNADNPTNVFGPAILVGVLGGAIFVAVLLVTWGNPAQTASMQTGPRGTGMSVPEFDVARLAPDPTIDAYYTEAAYKPNGDEELAKDIYKNVQVLGDLTEDNFNRVMNAMTQWVSPEEGCAYCHGDVDLEEYGSDKIYTKVVARRMIQMTQSINEDWSGHVNAVAEVGVNCYTCHRGENVPSDIWFRISPVNENVEGWSANQNRATSLSQSTSLPSDALAKYLEDTEVIAVHSLESREDGVPGQDGYASIQQTERTYSLMNYFSNSLGVNCVFCHNSRAFYDGGQNTPQWSTASLGIAMVQSLNTDYLVPLKDTYPPERLGPVYADAPKAACRTCHKGYQRPLQGMNMTADWPELAVSGTPVYK
ncbi:MAG: photosynthetic reaction center cytochrome c subunit [Tateyamaria sp.]|jgi:photosynthetic reaction center cytochrome c subunit|nr:photosynthetic reaction center cytochrome c subunit [Tateyamaria sp.]MBT5300809.1 photosynthetic reaction center cytochrome c subunit [Tateyamaria sp.]MBT6343298.1 photosynthetic reaction center cytochrome c subunit [Tateyamaria sp.]MBT7446498.1 photosynthetic reaction center cytochrome c subunit [Tateyamaria sp.]MBT7802306.1 photosynthetic reaction center cytochrome c subunit [Tateyamaria sp.]